jgi:hypothetical protein
MHGLTRHPLTVFAVSMNANHSRVRDACAFCLQRRNLRRTLRIALVVGVVLTLINQGGVIAAGHASTATWVRCALNFVVPFLVSNAGLLSGRR